MPTLDRYISSSSSINIRIPPVVSMSQPKQLPPFPNSYATKKVADSDAKPCTICYKPATTVLLNDNKMDFFYTCDLHLQDEHFATPLPNEEHAELVKSREELEKNLTDLKTKMDAVKPYIWNKLMMDYIPGMSSDTKTSTNDKDDKKDSEKSANKSNNEKFKEYETEIRDKTIKLSETNIKISQFKFKAYKLNQDVYRGRIQNYVKAKMNQARTQKIQSDPTFFPTVPSNKLE